MTAQDRDEFSTGAEGAPALLRNAPAEVPEVAETAEYTVSELSHKIRRCLEEGFDRVRVRAELGRVSRAASGHIYLDLKDEGAVINGVMWRSRASSLRFEPETGLEVVCTGRLGTYPLRSNYQLVIEDMQPAGEGALMAMLEQRRRKLAAEGWFDQERKQPLPHLPRVIGVITSPGGAVIHDILHRLGHRFPRHVLLWPARVQGEQCADEVVAGIEGFNGLAEGGGIPRPDLLIVARGGGSLEDLWPFNEERVVRAAAESKIPLISAIGHESDVTLIDHAADQRAPTPSAAAEMAVPVRTELVAATAELARRLSHGMERRLSNAGERLAASERHIRRSADILALLSQRFDMVEQRLAVVFTRNRENRLQRFAQASARVSPHALHALLRRVGERVGDASARAQRGIHGLVSARRERFQGRVELLEACSHQRVLERGFVLVWDSEERLLCRAKDTRPGMSVALEFAGAERVGAVIAKTDTKPDAKPRQGRPEGGQEALFVPEGGEGESR